MLSQKFINFKSKNTQKRLYDVSLINFCFTVSGICLEVDKWYINNKIPGSGKSEFLLKFVATYIWYNKVFFMPEKNWERIVLQGKTEIYINA